MGNLGDKLRARLTYANVVSTMCLFLLLGGTAAAVDGSLVDGSLPGQNTVGSQDIINSEVYSRDVRSNQIFSTDVRDDDLLNGGLAAEDLAPDSVGTSEVDGSLTGDDIENESLTGADVKDRELSRADYTSISGVTYTQGGVTVPNPPTSACFPISVSAPGVNVGDIGMVVLDSTAPNGMIVRNEVQPTAGQLRWQVCATGGATFGNWNIKFHLTALR